MRPKIVWLATMLAMMLAMMPASQASADEVASPTSLAGLSDEQLRERVTSFFAAGGTQPCTDYVPFSAELSRRHPDQPTYSSAAQYAQALCASSQGQYADALRLLKQAETSYRSPIYESLGLALAESLNDGPEALARLKALKNTGVLANAPFDAIATVTGLLIRQGLEAESDQLDYEMTQAASFAEMPDKEQQYLASAALRHEARIRQTRDVDRLLGYIHSPSLIAFMLAFRDYEFIWPSLEQYAGDHLARITESDVSWTAARLADKPEDRDRLQAYAQALFAAGRDDEAISVAESWLGRSEKQGALEEGDGWALNLEADALDGKGETAKADAIFDRLAALSPDEHPWVVNFVINREGRLVQQGRWNEGLEASELARTVAEKYGSAYARAAVTADRACAFFNLGRKEDAQHELRFLTDHPGDSPRSIVLALLCAGREDEAATLTLGMLRDPKTRDSLLTGLQDDRFSFEAQAESKLPSTRGLIMNHADLREEALKYVRLLPDNLVPLGYQRREQSADANRKH